MEVSVDGLCKSFRDRALFRDFSYSFAPGEVNVILGESGSGKTTLLNMLALFEPPDSGKILYDGHTVTGLKSSERRKTIRSTTGYVYQDIRLFDDLSVNDNMRLALRFSTVPRRKWKTSIDEMLERMGMVKYRDTVAAKLSGGERQRIAIARALVSNKKLLLADEPTGALDEGNTRRIMKLLHDASSDGDVTVILVTHSMLVAHGFAHRCWLHDGRLQQEPQSTTQSRVESRSGLTTGAGLEMQPVTSQGNGTL